jgi:hypothetical protein
VETIRDDLVMKRILGALAAFLVVVFGGYALTQATPSPFNINTNGGWLGGVDGGSISNLAVTGSATLPNIFSLSADAGVFGSLTVLGATTFSGLAFNGLTVDGGVQAGGLASGASWCLGQVAGFPTDASLSAGVCTNGFASLSSIVVQWDGTNSYFKGQSGAFSYLTSGATNVGEVGVINGSSALGVIGLNVGSPLGAGSNISNFGQGTCVLSSGTCNAVTRGTTASSLCECNILSQANTSYWYTDAGAFQCTPIADAGATTVIVETATGTLLPGSATVGVRCFN